MLAIINFVFAGLFLSSSFGSMVITEDEDNGTIGDSSISTEDLLEALKIGRKYVEDLERLEADMILHSKQVLNEKSRHNRDYSRYRPHSPEAIAQSRTAAVELIARKRLSEKFGVPADHISFDEVASEHSSHQRNKRAAVCSGQFGSLTGSRTFDGTCNNLNNTDYGKSSSIYQRLIPPVYSDGIGAVRSAPLVRVISNTVLFNESLPNYSNTLLVMTFGQFLDHDMINTPTFRLANSAIRCCDGPQFGNVITPAPHPECLPILLPSNDQLYGPSNCMNFVRSTFGTNLDGSTPPYRQSINDNTHWIDGSMIYGSDATFAATLRNTSAGRGLMATSGSRNLLPVLTTCCPGDPTNSCPAAQSCFVAGDGRVTEHPFLTVMHTIWVREHNRIANILYNSNPVLSDETIFQQARKIVIAEFQHIVYTEYLPTIIGSTLATAVYDGTYGPIFSVSPNPAIFTEFSTAALRMGHSQIKSFMRVIDSNGGVNTTLSFFLGDAFSVGGFRLLDPNFIDGALRGMLLTPVQKVDNCFADDITSQLFRTPGKGNLGFDLISRNIQRGRDHGIPPYYRFWKNPNFATVNPNPPINFDSLASTHTQEVIAYLKRAYASVTDVDLYVGGVTEIPLAGAVVGPTFANIFAKQFDNLKQADRFFYNIAVKSGDKVPQFTAAQLAELKKVTFSRIICDNSDKSITTIQPQAFSAADTPNNLPVSCNSIPSMNPSVWSLA